MAIKDAQRCEFVAEAFAKKLQSNYDPDEQQETGGRDALPQVPFTEVIEGEYRPKTNMEIKKAINNLALAKPLGEINSRQKYTKSCRDSYALSENWPT